MEKQYFTLVNEDGSETEEYKKLLVEVKWWVKRVMMIVLVYI